MCLALVVLSMQMLVADVSSLACFGGHVGACTVTIYPLQVSRMFGFVRKPAAVAQVVWPGCHLACGFCPVACAVKLLLL